MLVSSGLLAVYLIGFARYNINYDGAMVFGSEWAIPFFDIFYGA
jgi:hypothetical protein